MPTEITDPLPVPSIGSVIPVIVPVANQGARLALTIQQAAGNTVKQADDDSTWMLVLAGDPAEVSDWIQIGGGGAGAVSWSSIADKPVTFPPHLPTVVTQIPTKRASLLITVTGGNSESWSVTCAAVNVGGSSSFFGDGGDENKAAGIAAAINGEAGFPFTAHAAGTSFRLVAKDPGELGNGIAVTLAGTGLSPTNSSLTGGYALDATTIGQVVQMNHSNGVQTEWVAVATGANSEWQPRTASVLLNFDTNQWEDWRVSGGSLNSKTLPNP